MEWILFTIGLLIGGIIGMMIIGIVSSGKHSDLDSMRLELWKRTTKVLKN